jgi:hypothetical protein
MGVMLALLSMPTLAEAQDSTPPSQTAGSGAQLCALDSAPGCRMAVGSFAELSTVLAPGQEIIVTDESGRSRRGKIVSITPNAVVIDRERSFFRRAEDRFDEGAVQRVRFRDSTVNGVLGGMAVGAAFFALQEGGMLADSLSGWLFLGSASILVGGAVGQVIDGATNSTIYDRARSTPVAKVLPFAARQSAGLTLVVRF